MNGKPGRSLLPVTLLLILSLVSVPALAFLALTPIAEAGGAPPEWRWVQPQPQGNGLNGIAYLDDNHSWAVGNCGAIVAYNGQSWNRQVSGTTHKLNAVSALDATHVWAVGDNGIILFWDGSQWNYQTSNTIQNLYGVGAADINNVWAVGANGAVGYFNGSTWSFGALSAGANMRGVYAADPTHAWLCGDGGRIYSKATGGWVPRTPTNTSNLYSIHGSGTNNIWAVGDDGAILHYDGLWTTPEQAIYRDLRAVYVESASSVRIGGTYGAVYRWDGSEFQAIASFDDWFSVSGISGPFASADGGAIFSWNGTKWKHAIPGNHNYLRSIDGTSATSIWAVGDYGTMLRNNGSGWAKEASGTDKSLLDIDMVNPSCGWVVGSDGVILSWNGSGWVQQNSGTSSALRSVSAVDANHAWAVSNSTILFWNGLKWKWQPAPMADLNAVSAANAKNVWAVGYAGACLRWDGTTWSEQTFAGSLALYSVHALDETHVWVGGANGKIFFWNGASWIQQDTPILNTISGIFALDAEHVWAVSSRGDILFSNGSNWESRHSITDSYLKGVYASGPNKVWLTGIGGIIITRGQPAKPRLLSPNGGEIVPAGLPTTIYWDESAGASRYKLQYSTDGGATWKLIGAAYGGSCPWTPQPQNKNVTNALIRVTALNSSGAALSSDRSDKPFSIDAVRVVSPNRAVNWKSYSTQTLAWQINQTKRPVGSVKVYYSPTGDAPWIEINTGVTDVGVGVHTCTWTVPLHQSPVDTARIKVKMFDTDNQLMAADTCDMPFTISW